MRPKFPTTQMTLAYLCVLEEGFLEFLRVCGVNTADLNDEYRAIIDEYVRLCESNGREYAVWKLAPKVAPFEEFIEPAFPRDQAAFRAWAEEALNKARVDRLVENLKKDPENALGIIQDFMERKSSGVNIRDAAEMADVWMNEFIARREKGEVAVKLPGFELISNMVGGFNPGRLTQIMADTGFGKTNVGAHLAIAASKIMPALYLNMEMVPYDMIERVLVASSGISYADLYRDGEHLASQAAFSVAECQLRISDGSELTLAQVESAIQLEKKTRGTRFVVVDYDQKMVLHTSRDTPEWQALHRATVALEGLAKKLSVHIVVLAQTNSEGGISGSKRSSFPASAVLRFYEAENGQVRMEAVKNRFGRRGSAVWCIYDPAKALVQEKEMVHEDALKKVKRKIKSV